MVEIGELCELGRGRVINKNDIEKNPGQFPVYSSQTTDDGIFGYLGSYDFDGEYVTWTTDGANAGTVFYRSGKFNCTNVCGTLKARTDKVLMKYLSKVLDTVAYKYVVQVGNPKLMNNVMAKIKIPLPPIEVQKEIVEQIEVKQNAIDHAKAIIRNLERERRYFGQSLRKLEGVEWVELGDLFEKVSDQINPQNSSGQVVYIGLENIESNSGNIVGEINTEIKSIRSIKNVFKESDILYGKLRPNLNKVWLAERKGICSTDILVLRKKKEEMNPWLYTIILRSEEFNAEVLKGLKGAQLPRVSFDYLSKLKIPYLAEKLQERYLSDLKNEEEVIKANKKLIEIYEQKISDVLSEI